MSVFIIAEIGINHNGDLGICLRLIDEAKRAGCNAVKFQKRDIDCVYSQQYLAESRMSPWGNTQRDQKAGLEFGETEYREIDSYCKRLSMEWFASAWDLNSQIFLQKFNLKYNKVASAMITHIELLKMIAAEQKHTFISTGMSTIEDIKIAVDIFRDAGCSFELMHTVSTYPMRSEHANLRVIDTLKRTFECDVGYSGHESGLAISTAAVGFGISSLERHITLDRTMYGSDQAASIEPDGLYRLVSTVRKVELALGDGVKRIIDEEIPIAKKLRAHVNV